jgi:sugar lactone lactonase YvrE
VYRTPVTNPAITIVGLIPAPLPTTQCSPSGLAFGPDGRMYVSQANGVIYRFTPSAASPPTADSFASGMPGTNGLAFDRHGNLWTGDGTTGQGRVWKVTSAGLVTEVFRVQPMANEIAGGVNVGRDVRTLPTGTITVTPTSRNASNTEGSQPLVANGVAFDRNGRLYIADTARGAIWRVRFNSDGSLASRTGCDSTFTANTLCLDNVWFQHPFLEGVDGIVLDAAHNIWGVANERNAIVFVQSAGFALDVFRNPVDPVTQLRNRGPLETPASPVLVDNKLCTSNSDGGRRDNAPPTAGEIGGTNQPRGKISCIDQRVTVRGLPLPIR